MEDDTQTLPCLSPPHSPATLSKVLTLSPSLPQHSCALPSSLPLSPTSLSPSTPAFCQQTAQSHPHSSQAHSLSTPQFSGGQNSHCLSPSTPSNEDDLTCLSWLHQRDNLLPLQPLPKITSLPQLEPQDNVPASSLPPSPSKPPYSFSSLIFMAIEDSPEKQLPVRGIYEWIVNNFPYYRAAPSGWRNSVRHNLSLSKSFRRIHRDKSQSVGKGSLWCVCPEYRPALLEVLRKTHYCHSSSSNLLNSRILLEAAECGQTSVGNTMEISDLASNGSSLSTNQFCPFTTDHEELVAIESVELKEETEEEAEKDSLADSGYIEFHYYQGQEYHYLVLPGDTELDLETVEILQLDAEAQEAAGSLLDLAGGSH
ncbi:forkhead box protein N2-like [Chanos chanos]|uniref:Forkhead box protein N2-like n=1 Tax=Chanos chanos TaxID=29144 RepID=A0A6J2UUN6_CHACN|nr:forkhead box protein N2-like [Chanos chanos]